MRKTLNYRYGHQLRDIEEALRFTKKLREHREATGKGTFYERVTEVLESLLSQKDAGKETVVLTDDELQVAKDCQLELELAHPFTNDEDDWLMEKIYDLVWEEMNLQRGSNTSLQEGGAIMKRPNLKFSDQVDMALTFAARKKETTKSDIAEKALKEYLLKNFPDECKIAKVEGSSSL